MGWLTVMSPSPQAATRAALSMETAGATRSGTGSARSHTLARSTRTRPSRLTSSPASNERITSTHSSSRRVRVSLSGQASPVMCSLEASPLPRATQNRPGNITPRVAIFCATTAGWYR